MSVKKIKIVDFAVGGVFIGCFLFSVFTILFGVCVVKDFLGKGENDSNWDVINGVWNIDWIRWGLLLSLIIAFLGFFILKVYEHLISRSVPKLK